MSYNNMLDEIHNYSIDTANRRIYLHGYVGSVSDDYNPGVEYRMAANFLKNIRTLDSISQEPIVIHLHSIGGNWGDGMAIYDSILTCRSHVTILVYGQAESMSSIVLQAADKRIMMPNSYFMIHYGSIELSGNYLDAVNALEMEKRSTSAMLEIYWNSMINSKFYKEKLRPQTQNKAFSFLTKKLKDGDWYLSPDEAVYYGFADGVVTSGKYKTIDNL